jgi:hypothetical protein
VFCTPCTNGCIWGYTPCTSTLTQVMELGPGCSGVSWSVTPCVYRSCCIGDLGLNTRGSFFASSFYFFAYFMQESRSRSRYLNGINRERLPHSCVRPIRPIHACLTTATVDDDYPAPTTTMKRMYKPFKRVLKRLKLPPFLAASSPKKSIDKTLKETQSLHVINHLN